MLTYISCLTAFIALSNAAVIIQQDYDGKQVCCLALKHTRGPVEEEYTSSVPRYSRKVTYVPCTSDELSWGERMAGVKRTCHRSTTTVKYETIKASRTISRIVHTTCPQDVKVCCHDYVAHQGVCKRRLLKTSQSPKSSTPTATSIPTANPTTTLATTVPTTRSTTINTPTTNLATTTAFSPCTSGNITKRLQPEEKTADVEISPGHNLKLPVGKYIHEITSQPDNCTIHISILKGFNTSLVCPAEKENILSSPLSGEGSLDITCGDVIHRLGLPIGDYKYEKIQEYNNCSTAVKVADYHLVRRVNIKANYEVTCAILSDPLTKSMVMSVADSHSTYIEGPTICGKVCQRQKGGRIEVTCANDSLSIMWPTDQTYGGDVTKVPSSVGSIIRPRLSQFGSQTFGIFITELQPPVVRPTWTDVVLVSSCLNNKTYVEDTDSCL